MSLPNYVGNSYSKATFADDANLINGPPPSYYAANWPKASRRGPRWDPRTWGRKTQIGVAVGVVVALIVIIAVAVTQVKNNRYPAYNKLNYVLQDTYQGNTFFDNFNYFTGYDPTQGFVHYVDEPGSVQMNLTFASSTSAILKVDTSESAAATGRKSVRIESKKQYNNGLFIFDVLHTPYGCGTWPAVWLTDPSNWPMNGEIDVIESVNQGNTGNQITLHTSDACSMDAKRIESGTSLTTSCVNSTNSNSGCGVQGPVNSFGEALNSNGGGVYAMEYRADGIRSWFFPRSSVPSDITSTSSTPDPSSWGTAVADFPSTDCNINSHFQNQSIIANIDLCGSWAGADSVYLQQDSCPGTCTDYVANNPTAFASAYWEFASFKVYQATN